MMIRSSLKRRNSAPEWMPLLVLLALAGCAEESAPLDGSLSDGATDAERIDSELSPDAMRPAPSGLQAGVIVTEAPPIPATPVPVHEDAIITPGAPGDITLQGRLFYNDLRAKGRFALRFDAEGSPGAEVEGERVDEANLLGALDVTVDVYEIDPSDEGECEAARHLASTSVDASGNFSIRVSSVDVCGDGEAGQVQLAIAFRLMSCHTWHCYATVDDSLEVYRLWSPSATPSSPQSMGEGTVELGDFLFTDANGPEPRFRGDHDQAASVFAGTVDIARWAHREGGIDAEPSEFRMLRVRFPSTGAPNARASGPSLIHILKPSRHFPNNGLFHEYGHILHFRAWRGSGGRCSTCTGGQYERNGNSSWSATSLEYPYAAFKEGWANFVSRAVTGGCLGRFDDNDSTAVIGKTDAGGSAPPPQNGDGVPRNITRFFCDWLDDTPDDDTSLPGAGDRLHADGVRQLHDEIRSLWDGVPDRDALDICSLIRWYIDPTATPPAIDAGRDSRFEAMRDTALQNGLACDFDRDMT